jgi:uracil-DNA glycosylase
MAVTSIEHAYSPYVPCTSIGRQFGMVAKKPRKSRKRAVPDGNAPEPADESLSALREAAAGCKRCDLWKPATQTVFGEGPGRARIMVIGEQPGDQEDLSGRPFVGPAGKLFDRALEELGIDRSTMYVTNVVKHFKFERRGKVRLHRSPDPGEQKACRVWLDGELQRVRPDIIVCLGAIAAKAILGSKFGLMRQRGQWQVLANGTRVLATVHPSFVLRQRDSGSRQAVYEDFVRDLALLAKV